MLPIPADLKAELFFFFRPFRTGITQPVLVSPDTTARVGPLGSGVERKGEAKGPPSIPVDVANRGGKGRE